MRYSPECVELEFSEVRLCLRCPNIRRSGARRPDRLFSSRKRPHLALDRWVEVARVLPDPP